jgi:hypothetical protein
VDSLRCTSHAKGPRSRWSSSIVASREEAIHKATNDGVAAHSAPLEVARCFCAHRKWDVALPTSKRGGLLPLARRGESRAAGGRPALGGPPRPEALFGETGKGERPVDLARRNEKHLDVADWLEDAMREYGGETECGCFGFGTWPPTQGARRKARHSPAPSPRLFEAEERVVHDEASTCSSAAAAAATTDEL